ncbi:tolB protein [Acidisarcina polymorpha]|uniref:TolB protein n=1 Tax=Acidisarcina polymorpha TaxID=2211140 RepID=A0A2Z5G517_9BACT|nr:winged helix-turn-helix domain-containing protein [Acidisarcina polymorpha]AXC13626.1 tolB protein [Acidisarcina polymorpha]
MSRDIFVFAEFTFDSETGILMRKNRGSHLPGQTAVLLEVLLKNANNLVSREELRQVLWPNEEFLDYTQGINVAVNRLRHTLRDSSRNPRFLKTIPKRGYTFYAEVRVVPRTTTSTTTSPALSVDLSASPPAAPLEIRAAEAGDRASTEIEAEPIAQISTSSSEFSPVHVLPPFAPATASPLSPLSRFSNRLSATIALSLCGLIALMGGIHFRHAHAATRVLKLGIIPLRAHGDTQTGDAGEGFRLMLSDDLSRLPNVQVRATSSLTSSDAADIPRLSRKLGLDDLLLGSIARQGDQYDLKFELVRAEDATHLASFEYSGAAKDLPSLSQRLQQDVFHYLQSQTQALQTIKGSTNDADAYELYLQASYHMFERDQDSLRRALDLFQQATMRDPNFAAAHAGMATACLKLSNYYTSPQENYLGKAEHFAQTAIRLDPSLAQAHAVLGSTAYKLDRDFPRGEAELHNAIRIDSTQAEYRNWLAILLAEEGRFDEALAQLQLAQTSAPFWPSVYAMQGLVGTYARRDDIALRAAAHYAELLPDLPIAHNTLAWVDFETGHYSEAAAEWRRMALLQNDQARVELEEKGMGMLKTQGIRAYAELHLAAIQNHRGVAQVNDFSPAEWYACAGHRNQAIAELERLSAARDPYLLHVGVDPLFDSLHGDPRFAALLERSGVAIPASLATQDSHLCEPGVRRSARPT